MRGAAGPGAVWRRGSCHDNKGRRAASPSLKASPCKLNGPRQGKPSSVAAANGA